MTGHFAYCDLDGVLARLYTGKNTQTGAPADAARDSMLTSTIMSLSRQFDQETERPPGWFFPHHSVRLYSGSGSQWLEVDALVALLKAEYNKTPGSSAATWTDITSEIGSSTFALLPLNEYPKTKLFRMQSFYQDPYNTGNVRLDGIWGAVQPDVGAAVPAAGAPGVMNLTDAEIALLAPSDGGWWITPEDIKDALEKWTVYDYNAGKAGYSDVAANQGGAGMLYRKGIPPDVQRVIEKYGAGTLKLAMVGLDGSDPRYDDNPYAIAGSARVGRWAGWMTQ